jgi:type VI secretion system protein ImpM
MNTSIPNGQSTGLFGKLPAHGDFIHRNLPTKLVNEWDAWLQTFVGSTQERLGESWLEIYLTSPIWRFCLSPGTLDSGAWAGIVLPSVDRVGRYFPFSVLRKLPETTSLAALVCQQRSWFMAVEALALRALDGQLPVDRLMEELNRLNLNSQDGYVRQTSARLDAGVVVDLDFDEPSPSAALPHLLEAFVGGSFTSYSYWSTDGSDRVEPCLFVTPGMPPAAGGAALLDGLWEHWEWSVPVRPLRIGPPDLPVGAGAP